jgi:hypothetical protein
MWSSVSIASGMRGEKRGELQFDVEELREKRRLAVVFGGFWLGFLGKEQRCRG